MESAEKLRRLVEAVGAGSFAVRNPDLALVRGRWIWLDDLVIAAATLP